MKNKKEIIKTILGVAVTLVLVVAFHPHSTIAAVGGIITYIGLDRIWNEPE